MLQNCLSSQDLRTSSQAYVVVMAKIISLNCSKGLDIFFLLWQGVGAPPPSGVSVLLSTSCLALSIGKSGDHKKATQAELRRCPTTREHKDRSHKPMWRGGLHEADPWEPGSPQAPDLSPKAFLPGTLRTPPTSHPNLPILLRVLGWSLCPGSKIHSGDNLR